MKSTLPGHKQSQQLHAIATQWSLGWLALHSHMAVTQAAATTHKHTTPSKSDNATLQLMPAATAAAQLQGWH
jgi:hypothetical protein